MRRLILSVLGLCCLGIVGCTTCNTCNTSDCNTCKHGCGLGAGLFPGTRSCTHGVCDCQVDDQCCMRSPWVKLAGPIMPVAAVTPATPVAPATPNAPAEPIEAIPAPAIAPPARDLPRDLPSKL